MNVLAVCGDHFNLRSSLLLTHRTVLQHRAEKKKNWQERPGLCWEWSMTEKKLEVKVKAIIDIDVHSVLKW